VRGDVDIDGEITGDDLAELQVGMSAGRQVLSCVAISHRGAMGLLSLMEDGNHHYSARTRELSPALGVWLERDSIGYAANSNLYHAINGMPTIGLDPQGTLTVTLSESSLQDCPNPQVRCVWSIRTSVPYTNSPPVAGGTRIAGYFVQRIRISQHHQLCPYTTPTPQFLQGAYDDEFLEMRVVRTAHVSGYPAVRETFQSIGTSEIGAKLKEGEMIFVPWDSEGAELITNTYWLDSMRLSSGQTVNPDTRVGPVFAPTGSLWDRLLGSQNAYEGGGYHACDLVWECCRDELPMNSFGVCVP
jgi:hypothetical protein